MNNFTAVNFLLNKIKSNKITYNVQQSGKTYLN